MLSADDIRGAADLQTEAVDVPEWGGQVLIRVMSGLERGRYEMAIAKAREEGEGLANVRAHLAVMTVCDEKGNLLFKPADAEWLGQKDWRALDRIAAAAAKLNALSPSDIEALAKNSESSHFNGQSTESPDGLAALTETS